MDTIGPATSSRFDTNVQTRISNMFDGNANRELGRLHRILQVAHAALGFAENHGFDTYDISDAKGIPVVLWTYKKNTLLARTIRFAIFGAIYLTPHGFRKLAGVERSRYPHGSAMLACAYLELAKATGQNLWIQRSRSLLQWLAQHQAQSPVGECWGASFPWFSYGGIIPTTVGNAHSTIWAANAFLALYESTGEAWALDHCHLSCDFLAYGLNPTQHPSGSQSNSYTILDNSQCINVNADSASILLRLSKITSAGDYGSVGMRMLRFVVENQAPDGSWSYDVPISSSPWVDGYHTGMVLSALTQVVPTLPAGSLKEAARSALRRGVDFYLEHLFDATGRPFYAVGQLYPIDPYSCGQGIITLIDICRCDELDGILREKSEVILHQLVDQTRRLMLDADGSFFTARYRWRVFRLKSLRWAQAVLALALLRYSDFLREGLTARGNDNFDSASAHS